MSRPAAKTSTHRPRSPRPRGPVVWYGGKATLTKWLRELVPATPVYVEPYGGAASLLFAREPVAVEVYNDLDGRLVNLFRALQDPRRRRRLERRLRCTFYARAEFVRALEILREPTPDADDLAWAFFVAQNQCFGGIAKHAGQWARTLSPGTSRPASWWSRVADVDLWARRLVGVQIEQSDALDVIRRWDGPETTLYLDPPYVHATRTGDHDVYRVEAGDDDHRELVDVLLRAVGACVVSGYAHSIYEQLEDAGWERRERSVKCTWRSAEGPTRRLEVVWRNQRAVELTPPSEG